MEQTNVGNFISLFTRLTPAQQSIINQQMFGYLMEEAKRKPSLKKLNRAIVFWWIAIRPTLFQK